MLKRFCDEDYGQDVIEYALLCAVLSLALLGLLPQTGASLTDTYDRVRSTMHVVVYECDPAGPVTDEDRSRCP